MGIKERWKRFRPLPKDIGERVQQLAPILRKEGVILAYLFGSIARTGKGEDIDIALLWEKKGHKDIRPKLQHALNTERIDLLDLHEASPVSRFEVIRSGILIYKKNDAVENAFELSVLKVYKDTNNLRRKQREVLEERNREWLSSRLSS